MDLTRLQVIEDVLPDTIDFLEPQSHKSHPGLPSQPCVTSPIKLKPTPGMMTHACKPSACVEAGESGADDRNRPHSKFKGSLGYMRLDLKCLFTIGTARANQRALGQRYLDGRGDEQEGRHQTQVGRVPGSDGQPREEAQA